MKFNREKTPLMKEGIEKELMKFILTTSKNTPGATTLIDRSAGINGKWLKLEPVFNIRCNQLLRIFILLYHSMGEEEFEQFWNELYAKIKVYAKEHAQEIGAKSKRKKDEPRSL